jgi:amino acid adenylation domain-containing protein
MAESSRHEPNTLGTSNTSNKLVLTSAQTAIWLDHVFFSDKPIYNTGQTVAIDAPLDESLFAEAIRRLVQECDALRLAVSLDGDAPRQAARELLSPQVQRFDFSAEENPLASAEAWIEKEFWIPLRWNDFPLFRFALIKLASNRYLWVQKYHHLVIDAFGRQFVTLRVSQIYEELLAKQGQHTAVVASFAEAVATDMEYRNSARYAKDRDYWLNRFSTLPPPLIDGDRRESERAKSGRPSRLRFAVGRHAFARLEGMAKTHGATLFKCLIAIVHVAFSRLYDANDLVFGVPLSNRTGRFKEAVGLFAQVMPFRVAIDKTMTLSDALDLVDKLLTSDYGHRRFPLPDLGSLLHLSRQNRYGIYDVSVNYVPTDYGFEFAGAPVRVANISSGFFTPWALTIADLGGDAFDVTVDYDSGLIEHSEAQRLTDCIKFLLTGNALDFTRPISRLDLMPEEDRRRILADGIGPKVPVPENATLASLFVEQAARTPHAIAAVCGTQTVTYEALCRRAAALAQHLRRAGIGPDGIVGIALPRTLELIVAVLGVHLAGGAYLPLDPSYPAERIDYIVRDAAAPVIVTDSSLAAKLPPTQAQLVRVDQLDWSLEMAAECPISSPAGPQNLAYVIYTSGSTGRPKGVSIEHRNAVNLALWGCSLLDPEDLEGVLFSTSLNFDLSVYELFTTLLSGGRLIVVESLLDLMTMPERDEVRLINTVPSLLDALLKVEGCPSRVRTINVCGEPLSRGLADRVFSTSPHVRLFNFYGPTETTVYSTWSEVRRQDSNSPPIGKPLWNTAAYVLDGNLEPVPRGSIGELWIGGSGVARGYLHAPELTHERFLENPFGPGRLYRTGDLARLRADGELDFLGRNDGQVKINGLRVELGEIESQLEKVPGVGSAVCAIRRDQSGVPRLLAYAVGNEKKPAPSLDEVRVQLERVLPRYMIPSSLTWLPALPLTPNGKRDRKALPAPAEAAAQSQYKAPRNLLEEQIANLWRDVLKVDRVGVTDDFFDAGGDSLQATILILRLDECFGVVLPAEIMLGTASTVVGMAEFVSANATRTGYVSAMVAPASGEAADIDFVEFERPRIAKDTLEVYYIDRRTGLRRARPNTTFGAIRINGRGYRSPDIPVEKPKTTVRLAFLGGSKTYDSHVSGNAATWPHLTNEDLGRAFPGAEFDYINGALPAFNTREMIMLFREYLTEFSPDIAVILANDLNADSAYLARSKGLHHGPHFVPSAWAKHSRGFATLEKNAAIFARLVRAQFSRGKLHVSPTDLTEGFETRLEQLVRLCQRHCSVVALVTSVPRLRRTQTRLQRARGAVTNVFFMPYMSIDGILDAYDAYDGAIRRVGSRTGALVIEANDAVPGDGAHFIDSNHFSDAGSRRMAACVADALKQHPVMRALVRQRLQPALPENLVEPNFERT